MRCLLACVLLAATAGWAGSARILAVLPIPARSHHNMFNAILKTLAERGHQVVNYTPYPSEKPIANYTAIHLDNIPTLERSMTKEQLMEFMARPQVAAATAFMPQSKILMQKTFENEKIKQLLESNEKFDLVILEAVVYQEALLGFGHKFNAPVISVQPFGSFGVTNSLSGNSLALAYIPDFSFPFSEHMTFYERSLSAYSILYTLYFYYTQYLPSQVELTRELFKDHKMPSVEAMLQNISLFVNNAHPNVHYAQPYSPNIIPVGGIHLSKERKPLPQEIKKFLDEAKNGVVYLSLGSIVPDHLLAEEFFDNFINVFRRLPQRVLWKTRSDQSGLPDNVMTAKWMPQQDILAHPNVILFVTHGGIFSQHEAINAGVPVVCIPFFGDQPMNAKFYEEREVGVRLLFNTLSEDTIHSAVTTVLNNPKYKENMQRLSAIYRDRPVSASDSMVYWVEYVLRHRGAYHLRPASATLSWYQLTLLDVLATILATLVMIATLLYLVLRRVLRILRALFQGGTAKDSKKTN